MVPTKMHVDDVVMTATLAPKEVAAERLGEHDGDGAGERRRRKI